MNSVYLKMYFLVSCAPGTDCITVGSNSFHHMHIICLYNCDYGVVTVCIHLLVIDWANGVKVEVANAFSYHLWSCHPYIP